MSATDELRRMLDERGVKWYETVNHANCVFTWWDSSTFGGVHAMDNEDGRTLFMDCLNKCDFTPEQAIDATLGGTCETCPQMDNPDSFIRHLLGRERTCQREKHGVKMDGSPRLRCSLCGYGIGDKRFNYCPNCGARIEVEE